MESEPTIQTPQELYGTHVERLTEEAKTELQKKLPGIMRRAYFDMVAEAMDDPERLHEEKTLQMFLGLYREVRGYLVKIACEGRVDEAFNPLPSATEGMRKMSADIDTTYDMALFERMLRHDAIDKAAVQGMADSTYYWLKILVAPPLLPRLEADFLGIRDVLDDPEVTLGEGVGKTLSKMFYWLD